MPAEPRTDPVLVADIGGTNTRLALADGGVLRADSLRRFRNAGFRDLAAVLEAYLAEMGSPELAAACAALAGPVQDGTGRMTNLDWTITAGDLSAAIGGAPAALLNDLQAQGHALGLLDPVNLREICPGSPRPGAPQLVIGIGTGFNAAVVHRTSAGRLVTASECGHVTLPAAGEPEMRLARHLARTTGFAEVEEALSGRGLENIDAWHALGEGKPGGRSTREIMAALDAGEGRAEATGESFIRLLGAVAGDLALIHLPFGGICLIGGMARALTPWFDRFGFLETFRSKGRFAPLMVEFPVSVIEDDYAALIGCSAFLADGGAA